MSTTTLSLSNVIPGLPASSLRRLLMAAARRACPVLVSVAAAAHGGQDPGPPPPVDVRPCRRGGRRPVVRAAVGGQHPSPVPGSGGRDDSAIHPHGEVIWVQY